MKKIHSKQKRKVAIIRLITALIVIIMVPLQKCYSQSNITKEARSTAGENTVKQQPKVCGSYTIDTAALVQALNFEAANSNNLFATTYTMRVYFHICRNTNGSNPAATESQIKSEFNQLVADNSTNNICFINMGLNYVDNTTINTNPTSALLSPYLVDKCINIFYHYDMTGCGCGGNAYSIPNTFCSIHRYNIGQGSTISHEVGHCLGLYHTFETAFGEERISGSGGSAYGDKITDTQADPYSHKGQGCYSTLGCVYNGTCTDPNGASNFNPPYTNIMAYWPVAMGSCYTNIAFTSGQFTRGSSFLSTNTGLQNCESTSSLTVGPVSYSSGYHMLSAINTVTTNGSVNLTGTTLTTLGGNLVSVQPGFVASPSAGGLVLIRPSACSAVTPRNASEINSDVITQSNTEIIKCYPNPFSGKITIEFNLNKDDDNVSIKLFNLIGREVKTISTSSYVAGRHEISTDASGIPAGIYLIVFQGLDFRKEQKIVKVN